jgi:hypothetical protein
MDKTEQPDSRKPSKRTLEQMIIDLCNAQGLGKTICPTDAARAFAAERGEDDLGWRKWLQQVRSTAVGMSRKGDLVIYRKGKPVDPDTFRGVYRLGLPRSD